jgi:hypothetical protein
VNVLPLASPGHSPDCVCKFCPCTQFLKSLDSGIQTTLDIVPMLERRHKEWWSLKQRGEPTLPITELSARLRCSATPRRILHAKWHKASTRMTA